MERNQNKMFLVKTPKALKSSFPSLVWSKTSVEKTLYLTFDDGPTSEITEWVLDILKKYKAKATFFLVGENVLRNPTIVQKIIADNHKVGNHTFNHLNGWKTKTSTYLQNVELCKNVLKTELFRPPYGRIKNTQLKQLKEDYEIIMWDILSGDFDAKISPEKCAENVIRNAEKGSIIVFHDSEKAAKNLKVALPKVLNHFSELGFKFKAL